MPDEPHLLVVCTANICRSPLAAAALRRQLVERGVAATVVSAGLLLDGAPAAAGMRLAGAHLGLDLSGHRSRILGPGDVDAADLVVGMAREHVREVVLLAPQAWERSFTVKELVRKGRQIGERRADEGLVDWLARAAAGRRYADLAGMSGDDDVDDPIGGSQADFTAAAREIDVLAAELVALAWPPGIAATSGS
jgi:protein-tyrosine phosphatase